MININSKFFCFDNTGVKQVKCIRIFNKKYIKPGSLLLVVLRKVKVHKKLKKGQIYRAIVIRLTKLVTRYSGISNSYKVNGIILFKKHELMPLGTRIYGSVFFEIRLLGFMKIVSLAAYLI